jgi:hypothetical protein
MESYIDPSALLLSGWWLFDIDQGLTTHMDIYDSVVYHSTRDAALWSDQILAVRLGITPDMRISSLFLCKALDDE